MPLPRLLTPARRDTLLALLALALLTAPFWAPALHLGEPTYQYERAEVTTNGTGIEYGNESAVPHRTAISDAIGCSSGWEVRTCAFERLLVDNVTIPTGVYSTNPDHDPSGFDDRYRYVLLNDTVFEPIYHTNRSVRRDDGLYRVDLAIDPVSPERALRHVSIRVTSEDVPSTVAEAARTGDARSRDEVDVPETPIRLEDDTYYRVFLAEWSDDEPPIAHAADVLLTYGSPFVGLALFVRLSRRVSVTYVGGGSARERDRY